jgi:methoxymalonate biosynthesis acyl carrier protein
MNTDDIVTRIRRIVTALCNVEGLRDDADIFQMGLLSSLYALRLVESVEREFGVPVANEDLKVANFSSIDAIARLVARLRTSP